MDYGMMAWMLGFLMCMTIVCTLGCFLKRDYEMGAFGYVCSALFGLVIVLGDFDTRELVNVRMAIVDTWFAMSMLGLGLLCYRDHVREMEGETVEPICGWACIDEVE